MIGVTVYVHVCMQCESGDLVMKITHIRVGPGFRNGTVSGVVTFISGEGEGDGWKRILLRCKLLSLYTYLSSVDFNTLEFSSS